MITGEVLLKSCGISLPKFPNFSSTIINLYNNAGQLLNVSTLRYSEELFANNFIEKRNFTSLLNILERSNFHSIDVMIDEMHVILFCNSENYQIFYRN